MSNTSIKCHSVELIAKSAQVIQKHNIPHYSWGSAGISVLDLYKNLHQSMTQLARKLQKLHAAASGNIC